MTKSTKYFSVDLAEGQMCLRIKSPGIDRLPELARELTVEFRNPRSGAFHLATIAIIAQAHREKGNLGPRHIGLECDEAVRLLAQAPALSGHNAFENPYRTIHGMWAEHEYGRGIRPGTRSSYALRMGAAPVDSAHLSPEMTQALLDLLQASGAGTRKNLRLWLNLQPLGLTPADIEVRGLDAFLAGLKRAGATDGDRAASAPVTPPSLIRDALPEHYECYSFSTVKTGWVLRSSLRVVRDESGAFRATLEAGPYSYAGIAFFGETALFVTLDGMKHTERLTMVLDRPLSRDYADLRGVYCAIAHSRQPVAGKIVWRQTKTAKPSEIIACERCPRDVLDCLQIAAGHFVTA